MTSHPIGPWRVAAQWAATLGILLTPFVRVGGDSLLRVDLTSRSLVLWGVPHPLEQMFLLLLLCLSLVCFFLLATLVLGRVWCGWACPQSSLTDLTDTLARWLGAGTTGRVLLHVTHGALALLVGANLLWYFLPPREFFRLLAAGSLPGPALATMGIVAAAVYVDLTFVRRALCRTLCPYGRFQAALADAGTLALFLPPEEQGRCIGCRACVRACPTGLDIREGKQGEQVECIHCGRCRDACADVMAHRGEPGLIGYRFGKGGRGARDLLNLRTAFLLVAALGASTALAVSALRWEPVLLAVRRSAAQERLLADGRSAAFFTLDAANRGNAPLAVDLVATTTSGTPLELRGVAKGLALAPGQRVRVDLAVVLPAGPAKALTALRFLARDGAGKQLATARALAGGLTP